MECVAPFSLIQPHKCISGKKEQGLFYSLWVYRLVEDSFMEEEVSTKELLPSKVKSIEGHSNKV